MIGLNQAPTIVCYITVVLQIYLLQRQLSSFGLHPSCWLCLLQLAVSQLSRPRVWEPCIRLPGPSWPAGWLACRSR